MTVLGTKKNHFCVFWKFLSKLYLLQVARGMFAAYSHLDGREGVSQFSTTEGDFTTTSYFWTRPSDSNSILPLEKKLSLHTWHGKASVTGFESPFSRYDLTTLVVTDCKLFAAAVFTSLKLTPEQLTCLNSMMLYFHKFYFGWLLILKKS